MGHRKPVFWHILRSVWGGSLGKVKMAIIYTKYCNKITLLYLKWSNDFLEVKKNLMLNYLAIEVDKLIKWMEDANNIFLYYHDNSAFKSCQNSV